MFNGLFLSMCRNLSPFFLFLYSYLLGVCEASDSTALRAVLGTKTRRIWDKNMVNLGQKHGELGTNSMSQLRTNNKDCPKWLWINIKTFVIPDFIPKCLGQIQCFDYG